MFTDNEFDLCFPQLGNISCRKPSTEGLLTYSLLPVIAIFTVLLNLIVIISISYFGQLHTPTNFLLLSLAVSDNLVGLLIIPGEFYRLTSCWSLGVHLCSFCIYTTYFVSSAAVYNMVMISIDRYLAICYPLHYNTKVTVKRIQCCVCLCWLLLLAYCGFILSDVLIHPESSCDGECVFMLKYSKGLLDLLVAFILPLSIIVTLYVRVFVVAVSQARAMRSHVTHGKRQRSLPLGARRSELKAATTLGVVVLVFLICFCPYFAVSQVYDFFQNDLLTIYTVYLYYSNSLINPLIYAFFYPWFRKGFKHIVTLRILQPGSFEINIL
ncbi:trace amine-associated receptor 13c-like [Corythoichthys intestinalis]|uniref:trace amine-associated receptor 13c-like n=1 Tax=Corythoichthys intestinalis TaxID=161448 RepID=UPI0025A54841|nr:trace amine-associated receptor 13c-like [Corythoichthys intestinalis]XP_061796972.1 trace amine-associated receptor 13c-like [Nerophis lumbriciformis]